MRNNRRTAILVPFPQFNGQVQNSSMRIYYESITRDLCAAGVPVLPVTPESYAATITPHVATQFKINFLLLQARRLAGWLAEYWLFLLLFALWNGRPRVVAISQEYCPVFASKNSVVIVHDLIQLSYPRSKYAFYFYRIISWMLKNKLIITVSDSSRKRLSDMGLRSVVVYNEFAEQDCIINQPRVFDALWIGTKARHKGLETYLEAARHQPTLTFALLCPGISELDVCVSNVVIFENVSNEQILDLYDKSTVFVSTSFDEGYGRPAMEARLRGVPLILSDIPVYRELHNEAAEFFEAGDSLKLSQLLAKKVSTKSAAGSRTSGACINSVKRLACPGDLAKQLVLLLSLDPR
jgi:glycosyltransferase involved in cell wall biosynthesis